MNWFIVEQLPVIAPDDYDRRFGETTARELVRDHVLRPDVHGARHGTVRA